MKIKSEFILRQIAGAWIAMPVGDDSFNLEGVLSFNEAGVLLWRCLEQGCDIDGLVQALTTEYDVDVAQATQDATAFVEKLRSFDCLE